nr:hypothetical protein [Angustibacter aerolatus]
MAALAQQIGLPFVDLQEVQVDASATARVPGAVVRRHTAMPIGYGDDGKPAGRDGRSGQRLRARRLPADDRARRAARGGHPRRPAGGHRPVLPGGRRPRRPHHRPRR